MTAPPPWETSSEHGLGELLASPRAQAIREGLSPQPPGASLLPALPEGSPNPVKAAFKGLASIYLFKWRRFQPARVVRIPLLPPAKAAGDVATVPVLPQREQTT